MNRAARDRIMTARTAIVLRPSQPDDAFYAALLLQMDMQEDSSFETAATDGRRIVYNPEFVLSLSEPELSAVLIHEVEHVTRLHHVRRVNRDPKLWNEACDFAINPDLIAAGRRLPADCLNDPRFAGMGAESIYAILERERSGQSRSQPDPNGPPSDPNASGQGAPDAGQQAPGSGQSGPPDASGQPGAPSQGQAGQPGNGAPGGPPDAAGAPSQGTGQGTPGKPSGGRPGADPGRCGGIIDAAPDAAGIAEAAAETETMIRQAAMIAAAHGEGRLPGSVARIVAELNRPRVDWRAVLRQYADESAIRDFDWTRRNRRFAGAPYVLPSLVTIAPAHVVAAVDVSDSMNDRAVASGLSEIQGMLDDGAVERVTVLYCSTRITRVEEYGPGDTFKPMPGAGGGTRFAPVFDWIRDNSPDASLCVYLTDLDCSDHGTAPDCPVLWAATDATAARRPVQFGDVIEIDPHA